MTEIFKQSTIQVNWKKTPTWQTNESIKFAPDSLLLQNENNFKQIWQEIPLNRFLSTI